MKRIFALLLSLLMVFALFTGCSNEVTPSSAPVSSAAPSTPSSEAPADMYTFPLAEPIELRIWNAFTSTIIQSMNESKFTSEVSKRLGIHLKWEEAATASAGESFSLLLASDDLPDLIKPPMQGGLAALGGSGDAAIENNICIPINDLSAFYPNYKALIEGNEILAKLTKTDSGNMWGFHIILKEPEGAWTGLAYRKDLTDAAGYTKKPATLQDWEEMLAALRDSGIESPLAIGNTGLPLFGTTSFMSAYGVSPDWFVKDGTVKFSFIESGFKDYVTMMNKWYTEKLIDQDFVSRGGTPFSIMSDDYYRTNVGAQQSVFSFTRSGMYSSYHFTDNANFWLEPVGDPVLNEGDTLHINFPMSYANTVNPLLITTSNEYPEISCKFADYFYSEEGFILNNYGIEGESFTWDGDYPKATDLVNNDPQGREFTQLKVQWCWMQGVGLYTYMQSKDDMADPAVYDAYTTWSVGDGAWNYPAGATLTTEESAQYSSIFADIQTLANESIVKFITGERPLDEFDSFVALIKSMGIDECTAIKQASYDRYMSR